ncbi:MAG TPA: lipid-binding SYLF domain-containing protein [Nitrospiraceae bacterium]
MQVFLRRKWNVIRPVSLFAMLCGTIAMLHGFATLASASEQQQLVDKSKMTIEGFVADSSAGPAIRDFKSTAKALFIIPQFLRGAFVFGGAGGSGVLLVRDEKTGAWSEPAFYTMGSASFGMQIGGDVSEMVLIVRNQKGLEEFYRNDFKLGADASIAMGPVGEGAAVKGIAADIIAYAKKKGAYVGMSLEGAFISVSDDSNQAYYGKPVRPTEIVVKRSVSNPKSTELRNAVAKAMK